jgi:glycerate kinase
MKVVAAPNPFKGSLGAAEAAAAIARGVRQVFATAEVLEVPVADGGEGTVEALVAAHGGRLVWETVEGPLGRPVSAALGLVDGGRTAVIELAAAAGLPLVPAAERDPRRASTYGFGQLLEAARRLGVERIITGIGGSATNDGGAGMAQALGYRLLDAQGQELPRGGAPLASLARIDAGRVDPAWQKIKVDVASDVTNPLTGMEGATAVYGPQKGVTPDLAPELESALRRMSEVVLRDLDRDVADLPGAGAAGGAGAGLMAFLNARLQPGAQLVAEAAGLDRALAGAWLVFTGEGRVDGQTVYGKGPMEVARRASIAGAEVVVLAGALGEGWERMLEGGVTTVVPLAERPAPLDEMLADAEGLIERASARVCRLVAIGLRRRS